MTGNVNENNPTQEKSGAGGFEKYVVALVILCLAAGIAYQVFFCSTCYGITQKYAPPAAKTSTQ